jgi:hypothetical protein
MGDSLRRSRGSFLYEVLPFAVTPRQAGVSKAKGIQGKLELFEIEEAFSR